MNANGGQTNVPGGSGPSAQTPGWPDTWWNSWQVLVSQPAAKSRIEFETVRPGGERTQHRHRRRDAADVAALGGLDDHRLHVGGLIADPIFRAPTA
jgi:hypothetical protein